MKIQDVSALVQFLLLGLAALGTFALADHEASDKVPHKEADHPILAFDKYSVSVASNISLSVDILTEARELIIIPNGAIIEPVGPTTVVFDVIGVQVNSSSIFPITFIVPITTYVGLPITESVSQTLMIPHGSSIAVQGLTTSVTRVLFGFSQQTFPQLEKVVISTIAPDWPFTLLELSTFNIPSLI